MTDTVVQQLAAEYAPDMLQQTDLLGLINWDDAATLSPGTDWRDGHIYMTIPIQLKDKRKVGRGKEAREEEYWRYSTLLIRSDYQYWEYNPESVASLGYQFPLVFNHSTSPRWARNDMADFLTRKSGSKPGIEIHRELKELYLEYLEYTEPIYYDLVPLYIMASYVYKIFNSIGYIHFNGTASSGKTQNLSLLQAFGLNTLLTSNTSTSALFRTIASNPGILCLDEVERFESENDQEVRKLLLSGYRRGGTVLRSEKLAEGMPFTPVEYPVYSPKALASINPADNVLGSRTLVIAMQPALRRIREFNHEDPKWGTYRNHLYRWALIHGPTVAAASAEWNATKRDRLAPNLLSRQWQAAQVFITIADAIGLDTEKLTEIIAFFDQYYVEAQALQNDTDRQRLILRCLPRVLRIKTPGHSIDYYAIKDIHEVISEQLEEDEHEYFKTRNATKALRTLGFKQTKQTRGGLHFRIDPAFLAAQMSKRQIEPFDDDANWQQEINKEAPLRDLTLDWLEQYAEEN